MTGAKRTAIAAAAAATMAVAGLAATAPSASAATSGTGAYNGVCGSGYKVVNSAALGNVGTVYLTYNSSNGNNCVVTIRKDPGAPISMYAYLDNLDNPGYPAYDSGEYTTYAGPVYRYARGSCVEWGGTIGNWNAFNMGSNCGARQQAQARYAGKD